MSGSTSSRDYSLWLRVPPGAPVAAKLAQEIAAQAEQHGAPPFEPHVTLLGGIAGDADSIAEKAKQVAASIKTFRLNFLDVAQGGSFHRCVYLLVAKEQAVMAAGLAARQAFGAQDDDYMPHCSLLYADLGPEAKASAARAAVQRLYGEGSGYATLLTDNGFTTDAVTLWYTPAEDTTLASWRQVAAFPLQG